MKSKVCQSVLLLLCSLASTRGQDCSSIFTVFRGFNGLSAEIIKSNNHLESIIKLEVIMSVATILNGNSPGKISLTNSDVYNDLLNNRDLRYRIDFSFQNPSPVATMINFNGRTICTGQPAQGSYSSTLKLYHTHTLSGVPNNVYQVEDTTQASLLNSFVDLIAKPFTSAPSAQIVPQNTYYPQPVYEYPTTSVPQPVYYTQPVPQTSIRTTIRPTYKTQPRTSPYSQPTSPPAIINNFNTSRGSSSDRLNDFNSQCGVPRRKIQEAVSLVVNGMAAAKGQFPWLAAYFYNGYGDDGFICGGSLISAKLVTTAAHCVQEKKSDKIRKAEEAFFYFGKHYLSSQVNERDVIYSGVSELIMHPNYKAFDDSYDADLALAVLLRSIIFTNYIRPICIWTETTSYSDIVNQKGVVAGWGKTATSVSASDKPFWAELPVVDESTCLRSNSVFSKITSRRTFCVGSRDGKGPCNGDSGGGFVVKSGEKWYLRGIVSSSLFDKELYMCDTRNYAVFTDVAQFKDWIVEHVERFG